MNFQNEIDIWIATGMLVLLAWAIIYGLSRVVLSWWRNRGKE